MSKPNGSYFRYEVRCPTQVAQLLKRLHQEAAAANRGPQFVAALKAVHRTLRNSPGEFGEALFRLPTMQLVKYVAVHLPLVVDYAVHEGQRVVYLQNARLLLPPG